MISLISMKSRIFEDKNFKTVDAKTYMSCKFWSNVETTENWFCFRYAIDWRITGSLYTPQPFLRGGCGCGCGSVAPLEEWSHHSWQHSCSVRASLESSAPPLMRLEVKSAFIALLVVCWVYRLLRFTTPRQASQLRKRVTFHRALLVN